MDLFPLFGYCLIPGELSLLLEMEIVWDGYR